MSTAVLPAPVVDHLRGLGIRETMIATAAPRSCPVGWVVHFTAPDVSCPDVIVGDDGGHLYFPDTVDEADAVDRYRREHPTN